MAVTIFFNFIQMHISSSFWIWNFNKRISNVNFLDLFADRLTGVVYNISPRRGLGLHPDIGLPSQDPVYSSNYLMNIADVFLKIANISVNCKELDNYY